jgi:hypothetical protein
MAEKGRFNGFEGGSGGFAGLVRAFVLLGVMGSFGAGVFFGVRAAGTGGDISERWKGSSDGLRRLHDPRLTHESSANCAVGLEVIADITKIFLRFL